MRRAPSYSDSFLFVPGASSASFDLAPLMIKTPQRPVVLDGSILDSPPPATPVAHSIQAEPAPPQDQPPLTPSWPQTALLFSFKGGLHLLFISAFETVFYFLYVNKSENTGILKTINTYYEPLVADCATSWTNTTRWVVSELLADVNQTAIDADGAATAARRSAYNQNLLLYSSLYSVGFLLFCAASVGFAHWKGWRLAWREAVAEATGFVVLLGLYEAFFFRTIIYNYDTISTAEITQQIVDGLEGCASA